MPSSSIKRKTRIARRMDRRSGEVREVEVVYWRARYRSPDGKEPMKHFARETDAKTWLQGELAKITTNTWVDPKAGKRTLREYATEWEQSNVAGEAATRITDNALRLHILPVLGDRPIASIRRSDVRSLVKALSGSLGPGSVRNVYDVLVRVFAAARFDKIIAETPCVQITLPAMPAVEVVPPTVEEIQRVADGIDPRYRAAVVMLAGSGLRIGELLGLEVRHVDFLRRTVMVEQQRLQDGRIAPPKTESSIRPVPLGQVVVDALAAHLKDHPSKEWLFTADEGGPTLYRRWKRLWKAAVTTAKLPDLGTHDLRHAYASALISGGASVKQVQKALGHSSAVITLRVYSHLWPGDEDRTRAIIDAAFGVLRAGCGPDDLGTGSAAGERR